MSEKITKHLTTHTSESMANEIYRLAKVENKTVSAFIHASLVQGLRGQCPQCRLARSLINQWFEMPTEPEVSGRMDMDEIDYEYPGEIPT